ncbi:MAG TPA: hypothetical protein VNQ76_20315 [Planctomicrobium sp.]|nr:hypothetical protein [Planctomicrobium sp.]
MTLAIMNEPETDTDLREIPEVFSIDVPFQFAETDGDADTVPFELHARSSQGVPDYYYGAIYHDFSGMTHKETIPVDYKHGVEIGVGDKFEIRPDGLHIFGNLVRTAPGDTVDRIRKLKANNVPYEASIDFRGYAQYEEVPRGNVAQVNGQQISGPALIVRKWTLRGVAICTQGRDKNTNSQFSEGRDHRPQTVEIFSEGKPMTKATMTGKAGSTSANTTPATTVPQTMTENNNPGETTPGNTTPAVSQQMTEPVDPLKQFAEQRTKFVERFGAEKGTEYLAAGQTYEASLELHVTHLQTQLSEKGKEIEQLSERLNSLHTGEEVPSQLSETPDEGDKSGAKDLDPRFAAKGGIGQFAASIQFAK